VDTQAVRNRSIQNNPDQFRKGKEHVSNCYARGRAFEYRVRDHLLRELGAVYVIRAAGSKTRADLAAFFHSEVWLVQARVAG